MKEKKLLEFIDGNCTVVDLTKEIASKAGILRGEFTQKGISCSQTDMLIAASAIVCAMPIVTRNVKDFEGCQLEIINPFFDEKSKSK